ncbi:MAG: response regulator [Bacteroidales bacterium]
MDKQTILIVDDSESIRAVIIFVLEDAGYKVLFAENGQDALGMLNGRSIDLIITDLHMPVMDGIDFIKHARELDAYKSTPILFLTTDNADNMKTEAKKAGATGWIIKPFVHEKFLAAVRKVIK